MPVAEMELPVLVCPDDDVRGEVCVQSGHEESEAAGGGDGEFADLAQLWPAAAAEQRHLLAHGEMPGVVVELPGGRLPRRCEQHILLGDEPGPGGLAVG